MKETGGHEALVETVVKLGGSLMTDTRVFDAALHTVGQCARGRRVLLIPGGGIFAEAVRETDRRLGLSGDVAHWMAVRAMDQFADIVAERLPMGVRVTDASEIAAVLSSGRIPVLAPLAWLQKSDPLPHTWDVTSDSIAAWVAGRVGASHLVLVKPPDVGVDREASAALELVDGWFLEALPPDVKWTIVPASQIEGAFLSRSGARVGRHGLTQL